MHVIHKYNNCWSYRIATMLEKQKKKKLYSNQLCKHKRTSRVSAPSRYRLPCIIKPARLNISCIRIHDDDWIVDGGPYLAGVDLSKNRSYRTKSPQFIRVFPGENTLQFIFKKLLLYFGIFEVLNFLRTQLMRSQGALDAGTIRIPYNYINSIERHFYFVQRGIIEGSSCASCSKKS